jgi:hypothetical protein
MPAVHSVCPRINKSIKSIHFMIRSKPLVTAEELRCLLGDDAPASTPSLPTRLAAGTSWLLNRIRMLTQRG